VVVIDMDRISHDDLVALTASDDELSVSLFTPTVRSGAQIAQNPIRWKNVLTGVEEALRRDGTPTTQVDAVLEHARGLLRDTEFWQYQSDGLAFFARPGWARWFRLPLDLPALAAVGKRFFTAPVLEMLTAGGRFLLLGLSRQQVRLFEGSRFGLEEASVALPSRPVNEREMRGRPDAFVAGSGGAHAGVVFYTRGERDQRQREETLQYFREVDTAVGRYASDHRVPLLLAGAGDLVPLYRLVNTYPGIVSGGLATNAEQLPLDVLHADARTLLEPVLRRDVDAAIAQYRQMLGTGLTSREPAAILAAAIDGRIDTLLLSASAFTHAPSNALQVLRLGALPRTVADQLDQAATACLAHGGTLHTVPDELMPQATAAAALLRF
jgi:hypothetical protein